MWVGFLLVCGVAVFFSNFHFTVGWDTSSCALKTGKHFSRSKGIAELRR